MARNGFGRTMLWVLGPCVTALLAVGCGASSGELPGTLGELGEGTFRYNCVDDGDAVCNTTNAIDRSLAEREFGINGEIPQAIAVGARFDLIYQGSVNYEGDPLAVQTQPAQKEGVHERGGFTITKAGQYAFLAKSPKGVVADFTHLLAVDVSELRVWQDEQTITDLTLEIDAEAQLAVTPMDADALPLAGGFSYTWESSDPTVLVVDEPGSIGTPTSGVELNNDELRVVALGAGTATLTVTTEVNDMSPQALTIAVTVNAPVMP